MTTNIGTTTTYFVGAHYQVENGVVTKYYYAEKQRIAMRTGGTLNFLLGDHLGSTSLTTSSTGNVISELRYKAWGEERYTSGNTPTKYQYTGQYSYASDFGLLFYNARWYDSSLGRFAQADTIVPGGVQGLDRYAYVNNNPVKYTDPTGHCPLCIAAGIVILKAIDYGWTAYDIVQAGSVYLDADATPTVQQEAKETIAMAIAFEFMEPDELSPVALPLDDIVRHGDDITTLFHGSIADATDIFENGLDIYKPYATYVAKDPKAAMDAITSRLKNFPHEVTDGGVVVSQVLKSKFDALLKTGDIKERAYQGFEYTLDTMEYLLKSPKAKQLFNEGIYDLRRVR